MKYNMKYVGAFRSIDGQARTVWERYKMLQETDNPQKKAELEESIDRNIDDILFLVDKFKESQVQS